MIYEDFINLIMNSTVAEWNIISCWGYGSGPSYKTKFEFYDVYNGKDAVLKEESHGMYAVYKPNISVSLAYGLTLNDDFKEKWANSFPDPQASSHYLDLFYINSFVDRIVYVSVDGGRAKLPIPKSVNDLTVKTEDYYLIKLIDAMEAEATNFDDYFRRASLELNDDRK